MTQRLRRGVAGWLLLVLSVEKSVQHVFVTWAFAADRFGIREQVVVPHEPLLVIGGVSAVLFAVAAVGVWRHRRWAPPLLIGLALVDIVGEFIAQGTLIVHIMVSFIVAWAIVVLAWRVWRRDAGSGADESARESARPDDGATAL